MYILFQCTPDAMTDTMVAMETIIPETLLLLIHICSELCAGAQFNESYAKDYIFPGAIERKDTEVNIVPLHKTRHGHKIRSLKFNIKDSVSNMLEIYWLNSTIDSIAIKWNLSANYNLTGFIQQSTVEYFPSGGRFTSHPLHPRVREYTFTNLDAYTLYTICVHMVEVYGTHNKSSITHTQCVKINTIDYIRRESVIIMVITLGYYVFMGLLGYTQWKRKLWDIQNRKRRRQKQLASKTAVRWKELAENERLVPKACCSKELDNAT